MSVLVALLLAAPDGLSKDVIHEGVMRHRNEVKLCYEQQLQVNPELRGKVAVAFTIAPDGRVSAADAREDTLGNDAVARCLLARVKTWKFPKPAGGGEVDVTFPFVFSPAVDEPPPELQPEPEPAAAAPAALDPAEEKRLAEELEREREKYEREHPPGLTELWQMGGAGMYPVALALLFGLGAGALALVLALMKSSRAAVVAAGLALGGGAAAFSTGVLGTVNGEIGVRKAIVHVNPIDRDVIMRAGEREASVCWKFGSIALASTALLGAAAAAVALQRKAGA